MGWPQTAMMLATMPILPIDHKAEVRGATSVGITVGA
jgi:hypothetical protein